ncbi:TMV resistance protein N-like [Prunus avium]|uniref:TMV resistance protein N-like n=1 Tax=Prunus avium TaxID=42229 RepID=A0A6P5SLX3_PRUAV|nr:TMV resistance protein N-like [Prunus avium]
MLASMANQRASSSSASFTNSWKNQVFLSFRGEDTRHNFTDHLYSALCQQGINTFRDDDELRRGEEISSALLTAIEESKISVVVFSKNYASSKCCLDELVKILDCKESNQQLVLPVFYKVNPSDVRNQRGSFGDALANMERKYKDKKDKVKKWRAALSQAAALSGFPLDEHESESKFIQNIIEKISEQLLKHECMKVAEHPVGMQAQVQVMNELLDLGENDVRMVGVWGTGGIGKTTIAKAVYNSIAHKFEGCSFLANVRERSTSHEGSVGLQENLLSDILKVKNLKVTNVDKGAIVIQERLSCRKVLLVLDDLNDMDQLRNLAGACEWFGAGSRIIITTRDKQLLTAHDVNLIHEVKILRDPAALELLSWYAFKRSEPPLGDYVKLAERAMRYAQGLPLALKVLGSHLYGGSKHKWQAALDGFQGTEIQEVLKISYNALDDRVKKVFLDIACFFKGKSRNYVTEVCELNARYGIEVLIEKSLISVEHGDYIHMHDLLEKMGKDIIEQESPTEPGGRSRLWFHEDVEHVLTKNTGTNKITGIMLDFPKQDEEVFLDVGRSFSKMKNLKIFINYNVCLSGYASSIPSNLRVLDWYRCPFQSFPAKFCPKALVVLNLPYSRIKQIRKRLQHFTMLTFLNLTGSEFLTEIPDLSGSPNLRSLDAYGCRSLVKVDASVGYLHKLEILDLSGTAIKELPSSIGYLHKLEKLDLSGTAIKELLSSIGYLHKLEKLYLSGTAIKELPSSIGYLQKLEQLYLSGTAIKELPSSIGYLHKLEELDLSGTAIKELPSSVGHLTALEYLDLAECENLTNLPPSIYGFQNLHTLNLNRCPKLVTLPNNLISEESLPLEVLTNSNIPRDNFSSLAVHRRCRIQFQECNVSDIDSLENFGWSSKVWIIDLSNSNLVSLPVWICKFVNLVRLYLRGCKRLVEIEVQLPPSIKFMDVSDCVSLERFSTLSKIFVNLEGLYLRGCKRLVEIEVQPPPSIKFVDVSDCVSLERFSTLSKILEDGDMQGISRMDLCCHRLCNNLGLDAAKMANILLNQPVKRYNVINVTLPGSKVPEQFSFPDSDVSVSFSFCTDVGVLLLNSNSNHEHKIEIPIEIPWTFGLENTKLVLCTVWEITESCVRPCDFGLSFFIDGVCTDYGRNWWSVSGETGARHVWLQYVPLPAHTKPKGDDDGKSDDQLKPSISRIITVSCIGGKGLLFKSLGAHLAHISMPKDGDDGKNDENEENEDEDEYELSAFQYGSFL